MKQATLLALFSLLGLLTHGQADGFNMKATQKSLAKVNDSLYFSRFEVTNNQYAIFLNHLKEGKRAADYQAAQIDSAKWRDLTAYNEPLVTYYHTHPAYASYPVVNISFEGATLFCEWLSDQYNSNDKRKFRKVMFRLPTAEEWIAAAKGGNSTAIYPWEGNSLQTDKGLFRCNFIRAADDTMGVAGKVNDNADITAPSKSYWPNKYGLYNMSGNVAEMLAVKGRTMGGSWLDAAEAMKIGSNGRFANYDSPMPTIGFRYVMVVMEK